MEGKWGVIQSCETGKSLWLLLLDVLEMVSKTHIDFEQINVNLC